jgi:hypothetical protein
VNVTEPDYVSASELGEFLGLNEMDISRLGKAGVLSRIADPENRRTFMYDVQASVCSYITHLRMPREKAAVRFALALEITTQVATGLAAVHK